MADNGIISRGKYIFLIMFELWIMLLPALTTPDEKIFHIKRPDNTNTGYGMFKEGDFNIFPKKKVNTSMVING